MTTKEVYDFLKSYLDERFNVLADGVRSVLTEYGTKQVADNIGDVKIVSDNMLDVKTVADNIDEIIGGDMQKSVYDTNNNGIVDDSEKLGGKTPDQYASSVHGHAPSDISGLDSAISSNPDVSTNTELRHWHQNKSIIDLLINSGDGTKAFADNGQYVAFLKTVATDGMTITGSGTYDDPLVVVGGAASGDIDGGSASSTESTIIDGGNANG